MSITLDKPLAKDLINFKLNYLTKEINKILEHWQEDTIESFLQKAKDGRLEEAENDAIELKQLVLEEEKLRTLIESLQAILISATNNITQANNLIQEFLKDKEYTEQLDLNRGKLTISFPNGYALFIRYNDFKEYSYQFLYSKKGYDRFRYDNYDDRWSIGSRPHHFHPRGSKNGIISPMNGDPIHDMPLLLKYIRENVIF